MFVARRYLSLILLVWFMSAPACFAEKLSTAYLTKAQESRKAGRLDEAEQYLVGALQARWKEAPINAGSGAGPLAPVIGQLDSINKELSASLISMELTMLASDFRQAKRYDKAIEVYQWRLQDAQKTDGLNSRAVASVYANLGSCYNSKGDKTAAELNYKKMVALLDPLLPSLKTKVDLSGAASDYLSYQLFLIMIGRQAEADRLSAKIESLQARIKTAPSS